MAAITINFRIEIVIFQSPQLIVVRKNFKLFFYVKTNVYFLSGFTKRTKHKIKTNSITEIRPHFKSCLLLYSK